MPILTTPEGATLQFTDWNVPVREDTEMGLLLGHMFDLFQVANNCDRHLDGGCIQFNARKAEDRRWKAQGLLLQRFARDLVEMVEDSHFVRSQFNDPVRCGNVNGLPVIAVVRKWRTAQPNGSLLKNERQYFFHFVTQEQLP